MTQEGLVLVDYDGMFVPSLSGHRANELGHRNYQHPRRREHHFGSYLDNFSQWVIYTSLESVARDPRLFKTLGGGEDCLLFRQNDFLAPQNSAAFVTMEKHSDARIVRLARFLREQTYRNVDQVAPLTENPAEALLPKIEAASLLSASTEDAWWVDQLPNNGELCSVSRFRARVFAGARSQSPSLKASLTGQEPELNQRYPRRARMNLRSGRFHPIFNQLFLLCLPPFWIPVVLIIIGCISNIVISYGHDVTGSVIDRREELHRNKDGSVDHKYYVEYNYKDNAGVWTGSKSVEQYEYNRAKTGDPVFVRVLESLPFANHKAKLSKEQQFEVDQALWVFPFGVVLCGVELAIWYEAIKHLRLIRNGVATRGRIVRKWTETGNKGSQIFRCRYEFSLNGRTYSGETEIGEGGWNTLQENGAATVLYDSADPFSHCLYAFAFFKARQ